MQPVDVVVVHLQFEGAVVGLAVAQVVDALLLLAERVSAGGVPREVVGVVDAVAGGVALPPFLRKRGVIDVAVEKEVDVGC